MQNENSLEEAAQMYIDSLGTTIAPEEREVAREDFIAGYIHGSGLLDASPTAEADLKFAINQLQAVYDLAVKNGEYYSMAVAKFALIKLGALK